MSSGRYLFRPSAVWPASSSLKKPRCGVARGLIILYAMPEKLSACASRAYQPWRTKKTKKNAKRRWLLGMDILQNTILKSAPPLTGSAKVPLGGAEKRVSDGFPPEEGPLAFPEIRWIGVVYSPQHQGTRSQICAGLHR